MITKTDIIKAAIKMFEQYGVKFSMLSVATELSTSKRTIYEYFDCKQQLMQSMVDFLFDEIDAIHTRILKEDISELDKLKKILLVYPESINMDSVHLDSLLKNNPDIYAMIDARLMANWELTLAQLDRCIACGSVKPVDKRLFRDIMLSIYEKSLTYSNHKEVLGECLDMVFEGIER